MKKKIWVVTCDDWGTNESSYFDTKAQAIEAINTYVADDSRYGNGVVTYYLYEAMLSAQAQLPEIIEPKFIYFN